MAVEAVFSNQHKHAGWAWQPYNSSTIPDVVFLVYGEYHGSPLSNHLDVVSVYFEHSDTRVDESTRRAYKVGGRGGVHVLCGLRS